VNVRNLTPAALSESIAELESAIKSVQILIFPGGLDTAGSIVALFSNERLKAAVSDLLSRNGLILGINDGFKALVKLGLLEVSGVFTGDAKHLHRYVETVVGNAKSPWLTQCSGTYVQPVSAKEWRFEGEVKDSQIAFKFADGSVEAIVSDCGKILGKMAHFERYNEFTAKNIPGNKYVPLIESAIKHFGG